MNIQGYASMFNMVDLSGDVVVPGAFDTCLRVRPPQEIKMLYQHDVTQPIGVWQMLKTDNRGLWVEGKIVEETRLGYDTAKLINATAIDGLSIGFRAIRAGRDKGHRRKLIEIDLLEISLVTFPMQPRARLALRSQDALTHNCHKLMTQFRQAADDVKLVG